MNECSFFLYKCWAFCIINAIFPFLTCLFVLYKSVRRILLNLFAPSFPSGLLFFLYKS